MTKKPITIKSLSTLSKNKNLSIPDDLVDKWVNKELENNFSDNKNITNSFKKFILFFK